MSENISNEYQLVEHESGPELLTYLMLGAAGININAAIINLIILLIQTGVMNQARGTMYKQREIVLVPFPYSDLSATKKRPVLVLSNNDFNKKQEDVLVCVITSKSFEDNYSVSIKTDNLEYGVLPEPSIIKTH